MFSHEIDVFALVFSWPGNFREDGVGMWKRDWMRTSWEPSSAVMLRTWPAEVPQFSLWSLFPPPPSPAFSAATGSGIQRNKDISPEMMFLVSPSNAHCPDLSAPLSEPLEQPWDSGSKGVQSVGQTSKTPSQFPTSIEVGWQLFWFTQDSPSFSTKSLLPVETPYFQANQRVTLQNQLVTLHLSQPGISPPILAL